MSLDVYLYAEAREETCTCPCCDHEHKRTVQECLYQSNITHNLNHMAAEAGVYEHLWRPEEIGVTKAGQLIEPLTKALELMRSDPPRFEKHNSPNGWGLYEHFVPWVQGYLDACKENPEAQIHVSR